jgi:hypothetical protein
MSQNCKLTNRAMKKGIFDVTISEEFQLIMKIPYYSSLG